MSGGGTVRGGKCPGGEVSRGGNVLHPGSVMLMAVQLWRSLHTIAFPHLAVGPTTILDVKRF